MGIESQARTRDSFLRRLLLLFSPLVLCRRRLVVLTVQCTKVNLVYYGYVAAQHHHQFNDSLSFVRSFIHSQNNLFNIGIIGDTHTRSPEQPGRRMADDDDDEYDDDDCFVR